MSLYPAAILLWLYLDRISNIRREWSRSLSSSLRRSMEDNGDNDNKHQGYVEGQQQGKRLPCREVQKNAFGHAQCLVYVEYL